MELQDIDTTDNSGFYERRDDLESYFSAFREGIVGIGQSFESPYGIQKLFMQIGPPAEDYTDQLKKNWSMKLVPMWPIPTQKLLLPDL